MAGLRQNSVVNEEITPIIEEIAQKDIEKDEDYPSLTIPSLYSDGLAGASGVIRTHDIPVNSRTL